MAILLAEGLAEAVINVVEQVNEVLDRCGLACTIHARDDVDIVDIRRLCFVGPKVLRQRRVPARAAQYVGGPVRAPFKAIYVRRGEIELKLLQTP